MALPGAIDVTYLVAMDGSNHAAVTFGIDDLDALRVMPSSGPPGDGGPGGITRGHYADDHLRGGVGRREHGRESQRLQARPRSPSLR